MGKARFGLFLIKKKRKCRNGIKHYKNCHFGTFFIKKNENDEMAFFPIKCYEKNTVSALSKSVETAFFHNCYEKRHFGAFFS
jgi:hypothetical protein